MDAESRDSTESPGGYRRRLAEEVPTSVPAWKLAEVLLYLGFVGAIVWLAIANGADATRIGAVGILAALVMVVGEVKEIQVASWLTITFRRGLGATRRGRSDPVPRSGGPDRRSEHVNVQPEHLLL